MAQENEVLAALEAHVAARVSGDVDAVMESYSEAWTDDKGFTKRSFHEGHLSFTQGASGDDIEVDLSQTKIVMKGEEATCSPVHIDSQFQAIALDLVNDDLLSRRHLNSLLFKGPIPERLDLLHHV